MTIGSQGPLRVRALAGGFGNQDLGDFVFPAVIDVAEPVGLTGSAASNLSMTQAGALRVRLPTSGTISLPFAASSVGAAARAVAPLAGAAIVTIAAPVAGTYDIALRYNFDGAVAAAELNNLDFRLQAVIQTVLLAPVVAGVIFPTVFWRAVLNGAQNLTVNAIANGTATIGYNAQIVATRVA